jgi:hypothetical protein
MNMKDIAISSGLRAILEANGRDDCNRGINMHTGWQEVAELGGFDLYARTPAREAYEDGYYSGKAPAQVVK